MRVFSGIFINVLVFSLTSLGWFGKANGQNYCLDLQFEQTIDHYLEYTVRPISVEELRENRENYILLDTRDLEEYLVSTIPGAIFWNSNHAGISDIPGQISKDQPIAVFCSIGYRSEKAGEKLIKAGFTNVRNLYGSIFEWANRDFPLSDPLDRPTRDLHVYNLIWSRWVTNENIRKRW